MAWASIFAGAAIGLVDYAVDKRGKDCDPTGTSIKFAKQMTAAGVCITAMEAMFTWPGNPPVAPWRRIVTPVNVGIAGIIVGHWSTSRVLKKYCCYGRQQGPATSTGGGGGGGVSFFS